MTVARNGAARPKRAPASKPKIGTRDAVGDVLRLEWATPEMLDELQGPPVVDVFLQQAGVRFLLKRLSLVEIAASGLWPAPLTRIARKLMMVGASDAQTDDNYDDVMRTFHRLAVAAIMIPPDDLRDGKIGMDEVTTDMLVPMFVMYRKDGDQYTDSFDSPVTPLPRQKVLVGPESQEPPAPMKWQRLHPGDLKSLADAQLLMAPGALSRFLPEQTVDVASLLMAEIKRQGAVLAAQGN